MMGSQDYRDRKVRLPWSEGEENKQDMMGSQDYRDRKVRLPWSEGEQRTGRI